MARKRLTDKRTQMISNKPLVSVIMTVYNREKYVAEAIESVLASTYTHLELIVVDDLSADQSVSIVKRYALADNRVKLYVNAKNMGDYPNRNHAATFATGKYIKYLDSDDIIYPHGLEVMVEAMERFPAAALGIASHRIEEERPFPFCSDGRTVYFHHFLSGGFLLCGPSGTIVRRDIFEQNNYFGQSYFVGSDTETWLRLAAHHPVVKFQPSLIWWRTHEGQEFDLGHKSQTYLRRNYMMYKQILTHADCPLSSAEQQEALRLLNKRHLHNIARLLPTRQIFKALSILHESGMGVADLFKSVQTNKYKHL